MMGCDTHVEEDQARSRFRAIQSLAPSSCIPFQGNCSFFFTSYLLIPLTGLIPSDRGHPEGTNNFEMPQVRNVSPRHSSLAASHPTLQSQVRAIPIRCRSERTKLDAIARCEEQVRPFADRYRSESPAPILISRHRRRGTPQAARCPWGRSWP